MWPQGVYYQGWPLQPPTNPTPQSTDPSDWAQKAAQWAQQKQIEEQHYQQQVLQQHQQQQYQYQQEQQYQQQLYQQEHYQQQGLQQQPLYSQEQQPVYPSQAQPHQQGLAQSAQQLSMGASYSPAQQQQQQAAPAYPTPPIAAAQVANLVVASSSPVPPSSLSPSIRETPRSSSSGGGGGGSNVQPTPLFSAGAAAHENPPGTPIPSLQEPETSVVGQVDQQEKKDSASVDGGAVVSDSTSVDQELTERMKLFKEQLEMISGQSTDDGMDTETSDGDGSGRMGRGRYSKEALSRGGFKRGGMLPQDSSLGGSEFEKRGGLVNPDFDHGGRGQQGMRSRGGRGGRGGGRGAWVNPEFDPQHRPERRGALGFEPGRGRGRRGFRGGGATRGRGGQWKRHDEFNYEGEEECDQYTEEFGSRMHQREQRGREDGSYKQRERDGLYEQQRRHDGSYEQGGHYEQQEYGGSYGQRGRDEKQEQRGSYERLGRDGSRGCDEQGGRDRPYEQRGRDGPYEQQGQLRGRDGPFEQQGRENGSQKEMSGGSGDGGRYYSEYDDRSGQYYGGRANEGWPQGAPRGDDSSNQEGVQQHHRSDHYGRGGFDFDQKQANITGGGAQARHLGDDNQSYSVEGSKTREGDVPVGDYRTANQPPIRADRGRQNQVTFDRHSEVDAGQNEQIKIEGNNQQYEASSDTVQPSFGGGAENSPLRDSQPFGKRDTPTISSLQKGGATTVIPGLGSADEPEPESEPETKPEEKKTAKVSHDEVKQEVKQEETELKSSLKSQLEDVFGGSKAKKMVDSMERIVNQLQTLKGLESSLKVLQLIGEQNKAGPAAPLKVAAVAEVDPTEAARKKVAALLATESDSEGEMEDSVRKGGANQYANIQSLAHDHGTVSSPQSPYNPSSEPAREFDGTYDVKPKVFGTYSTSTPQDSYHEEQSGQGDYSNNSRENMSRQEEYWESPFDRGDFGRNMSGRNFRGQGEFGRYGERGNRMTDQREGVHEGQSYRDDNYPQGQGGPASRNYDKRFESYDHMRESYPESQNYGRSEVPRDYRYPPHTLERRGGVPFQGEGEEGYAGGARPGRFRDEPGRSWERQDYDVSRGYPRNVPSYDHQHQHRHRTPPHSHTSMDIEDPKEEKVNITQKLETIDYSHGVLGTNRGWADEDQHAVQSVDYNHGQGAGQGFGPGSYASQAAYGGFPGYPGYEGFPQHPGGSFPGGMDAAALFAAYSEQTSGDTKRKGLPKWLKEELEKMEKKRQKTLEKEAEELSRRGRGEKERPAWRDEESDPEEKSPAPEPWRNVVGGSGFNRHSKSVSISPDKDSDEAEPVVKRMKRSKPAEDDEENKTNMMLKLRKMLTEILLDVTNEEISSIAYETYEEENKVRFVFKEPKFKPKRPKPSILASLSMYESSSDSDEEADGSVTSGAKLLSKPGAFSSAIAKAFEGTNPDSFNTSTGPAKKRKSKWDMAEPVKSSSKKDSNRQDSSHRDSKSSSRHRHSSSSNHSRRRRSSSRDTDKSSSKSSSSSSKSHRSSSSKSSRHRSKSPPPKSSSSGKSTSSSKSSASKIESPIAAPAVPTLSDRWSGGSKGSPAHGSGHRSGGDDMEKDEEKSRGGTKKSPPRAISPSHSLLRWF